MENLGIDIKIMIAQAINFVLFFFLVKKFIAKPFTAFIEEEKSKEKEKQKLLENAQKQEEAFLLKEKNFAKKMREEMNNNLIIAKKEAAKVKADLLTEAKEEASVIKDNAKKEMESEKQNLYSEIKRKLSDLSLYIVKEALSDVLDDETKKKVSQKILSNLPKKVDIYEN